MFRRLTAALLVLTCFAAWVPPATAGSARTAPSESCDRAEMDAGDCSLGQLEDQLRALSERAKEVGEDAIAAGRAALDAAIAKLRERERSRHHDRGEPRPGDDVANI
ncbi:hypothetical protein GCM10011611_00490 [Aliidongia dinghuensis]|uniref:Secreted protein n=1 Tax=Aliidongia dinghuensis TaxID=1867774 RepID=A0A8J2YPE0_9PROT|nr:hypothetical protein [Aliidongia dinghuensis]GGE98873.1 hypothetical protein GCM10011611_00490 [Aliidongia dinghuensis]